MDKLNLDEQADDIGIDRSTLLSLYYVFINQTEKDLKGLSRFIRERNRGAVRDVSHHIKGASLNLEIINMSDSAESLVGLCDEKGDWHLFDEIFTRLEKEFHSLKLQISEEDRVE